MSAAKNTEWHDEMVALEAQLNSSVRLQIDRTREGIRHLCTGQDSLREAGDALGRVAALCQQSERLIDNYPFIKQVSRTHRNFLLVRRVYDEFSALDAKLERTAELLDADRDAGQPNNLLLVYHYISHLERFRTQTMELMRDAPSTSVYTIRRYFKKLDDLVNAFEDFFWKLPRQLFGMTEGGRESFVVAMCKVLVKMDATQRPRFNAILDDMISTKFREVVRSTNVVPSEDPAAVLDSISFWLDDLLVVRSELVPKFPPEMSILDFFVLVYHRNIHAVLAQCMSAARLGTAEILAIISWVRAYHEDMAGQLGISADHLEPSLLGDCEKTLIQDYVDQSRHKINEWISNLLAAEGRSLVERSGAPDTDADNRYLTPTGIDLFQIVKQHIETAAQASRGVLLLEIVGECVRSVGNFQTGITRILESEKARYFERPDAAPAYFEDYVVMVGNTCLRWVTYLQDLIADVEGQMAPEFVNEGTRLLRSLGDGFVNVARTCTQILVEIIFGSVRPAFQQLFQPAWHSSGQAVETIVATFDDYFNDYQAHADPFLMGKLVADVMERALLAYLDQMRSKSIKIRVAHAPAMFKSDVATLQEFFSHYRDPGRVQRAIDPLARFTTLISSSERMLFLEFFSFWKLYPDVSVNFFEEVLLRRDDLEKASVREIAGNCRKKAGEEKMLEVTPSIFSKLK